MEVWKDIPGYDGWYQVSNHSRVRSFRKNGFCDKRLIRPKILTGSVKLNGYVKVHLRKGDDSKHISIHRIIAKAFIPNPENKPDINHIDGNPLNNNIHNLEWVTPSENAIHAFENGLRKSMKGEGHSNSILTKGDVFKIHDLYNKGVFKKKIAKKFGIAQQTVSEIVTFRKWKHLKEEVSYRKS